MLMFWFGFSVGGCAIVLFALTIVNLKKDNSKSANDRHFNLLEAQLKVFNERMVEERRLACALETMVEHVASANISTTPASEQASAVG